MYTREQIDRANNQSIAEFFGSMGYKVERRTANETRIHGFGGLTVNENTREFYIHSQGIGGAGLVNCLRKALNMSFPDAMKAALNGESPEKSSKEKSSSYSPKSYSRENAKKEFVQPEKNTDCKRVYAYLINSRKISPDIVSELVKSKALYQDTHGNAVFLHKDKSGKPCGAEIHGTGGKSAIFGNTEFKKIEDKVYLNVAPHNAVKLSEILTKDNIPHSMLAREDAVVLTVNKNDKQKVEDIQKASDLTDVKKGMEELNSKLSNFKGIAGGTENTYFEHSRGKPEKIFVFESAIDLMSYLDLHKSENNAKFVALAGLKPNLAQNLAKEGLKIISCVDNDKAGQNFNNTLNQQIALQVVLNKNKIPFELITDEEKNVTYAKCVSPAICCFSNKKDYEAVKDKIEGKPVLVNVKNGFEVNTECKNSGVKDFNELLQKEKSSKETVKNSFFNKMNAMNTWSQKVEKQIEKEEISKNNNNYER